MADIRTFNRVLDAEHVISEAQGRRSREGVILAASPDDPYAPGTILGKVTATGQYAIHDPAASDGTEAAAAVLFLGKRASASTQKAVVHIRDCEINLNKVTWIAGITSGQKTTAINALKANGVLLRT